MPNKRTILLFVVLAYALAWIIWLTLWLSGVGLNSPWSQLASIVAMWMPALAVFLLGKITNQPGGIKSKLVVNLKSNWRFYLLAIWLPAVISFLGAGLYFLVFPSNFSLGFESIQAILQEKGVSQSTIPLSFLALIQILASLTYAPFLNSFFALGEEIGWRGYLYPALRGRFSIVQTHVLLALIWSLWHLPINLQGYNYGISYFAYPVLGVVAMFLFCFSLGILLSWLLEKTGSIWLQPYSWGNQCNCRSWVTISITRRKSFNPLDFRPITDRNAISSTLLIPSPTNITKGKESL